MPGPAPAWSSWATAAVVAAAAVAGTAAGTAPVGHGGADALWAAAAAAGVALIASRAGAAARVWLAAVATCLALVAGPGSALAVAGGALAVALAAALLPRRGRSTHETDAGAGLRPALDPVAGALVGALAVQSVLRLDPSVALLAGPAGALVAVGPAAWSAYRSLAAAGRRRARWAAVGLAAVGLLTAVGFAAAVLAARGPLDTAVDEAELGLDLARAGDQAGAVAAFERSEHAFTRAGDALDRPWAAPAAFLPVAGPQRRALAGVAAAGGDLAASAADTTTRAPYRELGVRAGTVDLAAVRAMGEPLADSIEALDRARADLEAVRSPWLLPPVTDGLDRVDERITRARAEGELALEGVAVVPAMLGGDGPRTVLALVTDPAQPRTGGGTVVSYALVEALDGDLRLTATGPADDLGLAAVTDQAGPAAIGEAAAAALADDPSLSPVDTVVLLGPEGLAALVALTGPVEVPGWGVVADPDRLLAGLTPGPGDDPAAPGRIDRLRRSAEAVVAAALGTDLPGPAELGAVLGPAVEDGGLAVWAARPAEQAFLELLGAAG